MSKAARVRVISTRAERPGASRACRAWATARGDYWKLGLPIMVWYFAVAVFLVPMFWHIR